jgi:hypothetical protein
VAASGAGLHALWSHAYVPGERAHPPTQWPSDTALSRAAQGATVLFFLHPRCPCSRVSMSMLEESLASADPAVRVTIVCLSSGELDRGSPLAAAFAPRVHARIHHDSDGSERRRFGAQTSGQTLVYDATGRLTFAGGLTAARGHLGPNPGQAALASVLSGAQPSSAAPWPVFGCPLEDRADAPGRQP